MKHNLYVVEQVIDYIEEHLLEEKLDLDTISKEAGYSKYHLHRMFTSIVGFTIHNYIQRRRLTEAASMLIYTDKPIIEIALCAGYDSQRSFSTGFKAMFQYSPHLYRKQREFMPLQLKYDISNRVGLRGDRIMDIKTVEQDSIRLIGYRENTKSGFHVIGKCWQLLHENKSRIKNRIDVSFLFGLNDYSQFEVENDIPAFNYMAAAQVSSFDDVLEGMISFTLPKSRYIIFSFKGKSEDSLQPVVEYIYKEWFPNTTYRFNENNPYDFAKYGEELNEDGESEIEFWVPVE